MKPLLLCVLVCVPELNGEFFEIFMPNNNRLLLLFAVVLLSVLVVMVTHLARRHDVIGQREGRRLLQSADRRLAGSRHTAVRHALPLGSA